MYDITVSSEDETASAYHGSFGYVQWAVTLSANENLRYLMTFVYDYGQAAKAYFPDEPAND